VSLKALCALCAILGFFGITAGLTLLLDPSGSSLGFPEWVQHDLPLGDFRLVGLIALVVFGAAPLFLMYGLWTGEQLFFTEITKAGDVHWAWQGVMVVEGLLFLWLLVETFLVGLDFWTTYAIAALGLLTFLMLVLPGTMDWCSAKRRLRDA